MGEDQGQVGARVTDRQKDPDEIRREIEETREDLGETAAALASKTDVKARAREKLEGVKQTVNEKKELFAASNSGSDANGGGDPKARASAAVSQATSTAQANPIPTAAVAAFIGGFLFGRITKRS